MGAIVFKNTDNSTMRLKACPDLQESLQVICERSQWWLVIFPYKKSNIAECSHAITFHVVIMFLMSSCFNNHSTVYMMVVK